MGLFWKRKTKDEFVTLGLNETVVKKAETDPPPASAEKPPIPVTTETIPPVSGAGLTPLAVETKPLVPPATERPVSKKPAAVGSPFATSVLGLNLSMDELKAPED